MRRRAAAQAVVVRGMMHHLDGGARGEPRPSVVYRPPAVEDERIRKEVVAFLAGLLDRPEKR